MAEVDVKLQELIHAWIVPLLVIFIFYIIREKYGSTIKDWFFAAWWSKEWKAYHDALRDIKQEHFSSMKYHKSADPDLRNKGLIRILEIGAGTGANFEFYPPGSLLTVVEPNAFLEPFFYESQNKHPEIKMEKFVLGFSEDMKDVPDNSIDVVVSTLVLCGVESVEKTLSEINRILAPGGKFYFWEHVHDTKGTWLHLIQDILSFKLLYPTIIGCYLNRKLGVDIGNNELFSEVTQKRFDIPYTKGLWKFVRCHIMGTASK